MLEVLGDRQKRLLRMLLKKKSGVTVDELARGLQVTRNAVRQHLAVLARDGLVATGPTRPSGGRPQQLHVLTDKGREIFPRHYSWFTGLIVETMQREHGTEGLRKRLVAMGAGAAEQLRAQHSDLATREQKVHRLAVLMDGLGYDARNVPAATKGPVIEAHNCVFHEIAMRNPEVCAFDLALLGTFTDSKVEHEECMARGANACRFRFVARK